MANKRRSDEDTPVGTPASGGEPAVEGTAVGGTAMTEPAELAHAEPRRSRTRGGGRPVGQSSPWVPALMVTCFLLGLAWLVVYYLAGTQVPGMSALGNWNLLIGIGAIAAGFVVSTQWR